jgi:hypothetical protein
LAGQVGQDTDTGFDAFGQVCADSSPRQPGVRSFDRLENRQVLDDGLLDTLVVEKPRERERQLESKAERFVDADQLSVPGSTIEIQMESGAGVVGFFRAVSVGC